MPSQVRNHYSEKNQKAHVEQALAFKKPVNCHSPSHVWHPIIFIHESYCRWLMSQISWLRQEDNADHEIRDDKGEYTRESTLSYSIEADDLDH